MACTATEKPGPSPAPRMMRQISSVVKLTEPTIGNCASAHTTASACSTQRVSIRLTMKPTTMAAVENRKKNEEPSSPNCSGWSFSSVMIGTPARPTTILSAKLTSMKRNSKKVIRQAPLGVGCVVMRSPGECVPPRCGARMLPAGLTSMQPDFDGPDCGGWPLDCSKSFPEGDHDP